MHALPIDRPLAPEQGLSSAVAVARVSLGEGFELGYQLVIGSRLGLVVEGCALELHQHAGPQDGQALADQEAHCITPFHDAHVFFQRTQLDFLVTGLPHQGAK